MMVVVDKNSVINQPKDLLREILDKVSNIRNSLKSQAAESKHKSREQIPPSEKPKGRGI